MRSDSPLRTGRWRRRRSSQKSESERCSGACTRWRESGELVNAGSWSEPQLRARALLRVVSRPLPGMLVFGLVLSILLMAFAANWVASLLERHKWLAYAGLAVVAYVALEMIWRGSHQVMAATAGML